MIHHYIKSFLRNFRKNFFFNGINLTGYFAGIFLFTVIFTFVYQELSFDRFHRNQSLIYRLHSEGYGVTPLCLGEKIKNKIPEVNAMVRFSFLDLVLMVNEKEIKIENAYYVDPEIFQVFSFPVISGNASHALDVPFSMVISRSVSSRLYGSRSALGETVRDKNGITYTITGIMEDFPYNSHIRANALIPIETLRRTQGEEAFNCGSWDKLTYLQLKEQAVPKETEKKLNALLEDSRMETSDGKLELQLEPLRRIYFDYSNNKFDGSMHGNLQTVYLYLAVSILILVIVIINYINLSIVISGSRLKQISIQKVCGATQGQIIRQSVSESCGVALISFLISVVLIELLQPQISRRLNLAISPAIDRMPLYGFFLAGILFTGTITGIIPGIYISRINLIKSLKNEPIFNSRAIQRKILLVVQLAMVSIMLNSTFILNKQITYLFKKDMGFQHENIVCSYLDETLLAKHELLKHALLKNPGIKAVSFSDGLIRGWLDETAG